ncbi:MAG: HDOD domain-containing protein [Candidatus Hydrogenedentes bacterium]|nr:HDOD domain-containing protein [Candidatus Hydrogenedentota bacterium]
MAQEAPHVVVVCQCGQKMKVPEASIGKTFKCVKCGQKLQAMREGAKPVAEAPPTGPAAGDAEGAPPSGPPAPRERIGQLLIEHGLITADQLKEALNHQLEHGGKTFEILISLGFLDKNALHLFLSKQPGVVSIDLKNYEIRHDLLDLIPQDFALSHVVLPIDKLGKLLTVGMACPTDSATIQEVEKMTGLRVKAMLCRLDDIHAAVKQYYRAPEAAEQVTGEDLGLARELGPGPPANVADMIKQISDLSAAPGTLDRVKQNSADSARTLAILARTVGGDPAIVAYLLKVANAAPYGLSQRVDTIGTALALLGLEGATKVLAEYGSVDGYAEEIASKLEPFYARAILCARAARLIARVHDANNTASAFTAGLLLEIGRFALAKVQPEEYLGFDFSVPDVILLKAENEAFNITHPEAGYLLAQKWGLPKSLADGIRYHHDPKSAAEPSDLVNIVSLAATTADLYVSNVPMEVSAFKSCEGLLKTLSIPADTAVRILQELSKRK